MMAHGSGKHTAPQLLVALHVVLIWPSSVHSAGTTTCLELLSWIAKGILWPTTIAITLSLGANMELLLMPTLWDG